MSQELSLVLKRPIEELAPLLIEWNNADLMADVEASLVRYRGVKYTDEQVGEAKKDKAAINAFIKALNDERIRIGKVYDAPLVKFKGEVDEVITRAKAVLSEIETQLDEFEQARIAEKQTKITAHYEEVIGDLGLFLPYERIHNPKWLNASTREKAIFEEIDKIVADANSALAAIEALHSEDEVAIKAFYFRTLDLGASLVENDRLKNERARIAELQARRAAESAARAEDNSNVVVEAPPVKELPPEAMQTSSAPTMTSVSFRVEATIEQLKELRKFFTSNNIKFFKI